MISQFFRIFKRHKQKLKQISQLLDMINHLKKYNSKTTFEY